MAWSTQPGTEKEIVLFISEQPSHFACEKKNTCLVTVSWDKLVVAAKYILGWGNILRLPFFSDTYVCLSRPLSRNWGQNHKTSSVGKKSKRKTEQSPFLLCKHSPRIRSVPWSNLIIWNMTFVLPDARCFMFGREHFSYWFVIIPRCKQGEVFTYLHFQYPGKPQYLLIYWKSPLKYNSWKCQVGSLRNWKEVESYRHPMAGWLWGEHERRQRSYDPSKAWYSRNAMNNSRNRNNRLCRTDKLEYLK